MADIIRLKSWKTYCLDGRSSVTYSAGKKDEVAVFVHVGFEPLKIKDANKECCEVDDTIVAMGKHIEKSRKAKSKKR